MAAVLNDCGKRLGVKQHSVNLCIEGTHTATCHQTHEDTDKNLHHPVSTVRSQKMPEPVAMMMMMMMMMMMIKEC